LHCSLRFHAASLDFTSWRDNPLAYACLQTAAHEQMPTNS
jgi:hypothetical protein